MTKTFWLYACVALDKVSGALAFLTFKTRRVPIIRWLTALIGAKVAILTLHVCCKGVTVEQSLKAVLRPACVDAARELVQRLNEEDLAALRSALGDPERLAALAQKYRLPDMDLFVEALKDEMQKREATNPKAPLSGP